MTALDRIGNCGLVPVIVMNNAANAPGVADALLQGGIDVAEITMRTDSALESIRRTAAECQDILVGAGTVLSLEACRSAVEAGARFIVSPGFNEHVVDWCCSHDVPVVPGVVSPSEIEKALSYGLKILKFFPANVYGGVEGCAALYAPYRSAGIKFIPTGGIGNSNVAEYIRRPFVHAVGGSWICDRKQADAGDFRAITASARVAIDAMLGFDLAHVGVYCGEGGNAEEAAEVFSSAFGFPIRSGSSSVFAGSGIEICREKKHGEYGHIAIWTNSIPVAVSHLAKRGIAADMDSFRYKNGTLNTVYLKTQACGFGLHLLQR